MNTLNLENINKQAPYKVTIDTDYPHLFYFHTDFDVDYEICKFFRQNNDVMLYVTETKDLKQASRNRLFVRWFNTYKHHELYVIKTAEGKMNGQINFMAIILRKDNPRLQQAFDEFDETIAFLFD